MKMYLAGPINFVSDRQASQWRTDLTTFLKQHSIEALNPLLKEGEFEFKDRRTKDIVILKEKTNTDEKRRWLRTEIIDPDLHAVKESDGVIAYITTKEIFGTAGETVYAYILNKPVYVICPLPMKDWAGWMIGCSTRIWTSIKRFKRGFKRQLNKDLKKGRR